MSGIHGMLLLYFRVFSVVFLDKSMEPPLRLEMNMSVWIVGSFSQKVPTMPYPGAQE